MLYAVPRYRDFFGLEDGMTRFPDESSFLRFPYVRETYDLDAIFD